MRKTGVDFALDVHSEEELPYVFLSKTPTGIPSWSRRQDNLYRTYVSSLMDACPEFQHKHGYKAPLKGKANLSVCCAYLAEEFSCLAVTQEQPFKFNQHMRDLLKQTGEEMKKGEQCSDWDIEKCKKLGEACPVALRAILPLLRDKDSCNTKKPPSS